MNAKYCTDCPLKALCTKAKGNRSFTRFLLRGLAKTQTEFGLVAIAHNLLKVAGIRLATFSQNEKVRFGKQLVLQIELFI